VNHNFSASPWAGPVLVSGGAVKSLIWSAFRRGGLLSVAVVACPRSPSGVALLFNFAGGVAAGRFLRGSRRWRAVPGGAAAVLVPVAGSVPFPGAFGPAGAHRAFWFPAGGVASLPALASAVAGALL
jgi:hypothetical protein